MARVYNGFLGDAIGKLGNVIFRKWNSMITASQYQPNVYNPNTQAQQAQRTKIKNLAKILKPFSESVIPLNFGNSLGTSTAWANCIKTNYPNSDINGFIEFKDLILSGGHLIPPTIISNEYDYFIDQYKIKYSVPNSGEFKSGLIRLTAIGSLLTEDGFNCSNIVRLPMDNTFTSYIHEIDLPDHNVYYSFEGAWKYGCLWINLVKSDWLDLRAYNPRNILNSPTQGTYFEDLTVPQIYDFTIGARLILPEQFHCEALLINSVNYLKVSIDPYYNITGLNSDDYVFYIIKVLGSSNPNSTAFRGFQASVGYDQFPIDVNDIDKPCILLYFVMDINGTVKSNITRYPFNQLNNITYCEMLFKYYNLNPDSIKINKPYTAIWGNLYDFLTTDIIITTPLYVKSENVATLEIKEHVINDNGLFLCSKLFINQVYTITISDSNNILTKFEVIGYDGDYPMDQTLKAKRKRIKFKAGCELATKVK